MALKGDLGTLRQLKTRLRQLPLSMAFDVAQRAAPRTTRLTKEAYGSGRTVYGAPRPLGVDGQQLDLDRTGDTRRSAVFTASGTIMRAVLGTSYAKYLIGKYDILPSGPLPVSWRDEIRRTVKETELDL